MLENGLIKVGSAKIFGVALLPGITLLALGGMITWSFWKSSNEHKKHDDIKETLKDFKIEINTLTSEKRELLFQISKLKEEFLELKKVTYDRFINNIPVNNSDSSLDNLIIKKQELSSQISELEEKFNQLKTTITTNISPVSFTSEKIKSTGDSSKLDMLKWVVEDNINLRKSI